MISRLRACGDYYSQNQLTWFLLKISKRANGRWVTQGCSALRLLYLRGADARGIEVQESFAWWRLSFCYVFFCAWCCRSCARRFKHVLREAIQTAFAGGVITEAFLLRCRWCFCLQRLLWCMVLQELREAIQACFNFHNVWLCMRRCKGCHNTQKRVWRGFFWAELRPKGSH